MKIKDFVIVSETIDFDDSLLIEKLVKLKKEVEIKRECLNNMLNDKNSEDYLRVTIARFSYAFAKEEYNALLNEAERRRLIV